MPSLLVKTITSAHFNGPQAIKKHFLIYKRPHVSHTGLTLSQAVKQILPLYLLLSGIAKTRDHA